MNRQERVWVVDDDRSIRWVLCRALQSAGFQAIEFEDAERASAALADNEPDAIVSDVRMPGRSGFDLLEELLEPAPARARRGRGRSRGTAPRRARRDRSRT